MKKEELLKSIDDSIAKYCTEHLLKYDHTFILLYQIRDEKNQECIALLRKALTIDSCSAL
jgi:hypothetical protein